ncbi:MAG: helix-hairpin-helix domain-containing protein [Gammaproteobacteria bacterium]|jgi:DNA uptake protein ComE-like DNA-binding protein|nr:helix-hairpin-helix domain-containing protein [Gammaproteobacteria bacterium]
MKKLFSAIVFSALAVLSINVSVAAPAPAQATTTEKLDINTATEQQLTTLSGVGEARAKDLIKGRPYKAKDDLVKNKIIPQSVYDKIKDKIIAK